VLVDTGSFGLRILASAVSGLALPQSNVGGSPLAECVQFIDNSLVWGPVKTAEVKMAGEDAASVPIQLIGDPGFTSIPVACGAPANAHDSQATLGANGILGIGLFIQDCGQKCATNAAAGMYYACPAAGCTPAAVPQAQQVQNPVALFSGPDNNGTIIELPGLPSSGQSSVTGSLVFGIGTQSNNGLGSATVLRADGTGSFTTVFNGQSFSSFIDSGSNAVYFLDSSYFQNNTSMQIPTCSNTARFGPAVVNFYCPASTENLAVTQVGIDGASSSFTYSLANGETQFGNGSEALNNIGGPHPGEFDWGLPFFYGRHIFTAIDGTSTSAGAGPYWAY
jgi:hypothetical protein